MARLAEKTVTHYSLELTDGELVALASLLRSTRVDQIIRDSTDDARLAKAQISDLEGILEVIA